MNNAALERLQAPGGRVQPRVAVAALVAWLFPAWTISGGFLLADVVAAERQATSVLHVLAFLSLTPFSSLVVGAPTLAAGYVGWFLCHRGGLRGYRSAAVVGFMAPLASVGVISVLGAASLDSDSGAAFLVGLLPLGAITGVLVRWIAYPAAEHAAQTVDRTVRLAEDDVP